MSLNAFINREDCSGCSACQYSCPINALEMKKDEEGFLYPYTNESLCIDCGLCRKVCSFKEQSKDVSTIKVYAAIHKDKNIVNISSSGGMFTALSDFILSNGGTVYGAVFRDDYRKVYHDRASDVQQRNHMRGSKYVQSDLKDIFLKVKEDLENGLMVLFTGTPCQAAGIKRFLDLKKTKQDKLYICDIICHGTPSSDLWMDYIDYLEKKHTNIITNFSFRSKDKGWKKYSLSVKSNNIDISKQCNKKDSFLKLYLNYSGVLRPSCYNCKFTNLKRPSDITIGDFWNVELSLPEMDDNTGVSLVLLNTHKGQEVFSKVKNELQYKESNTNDCFQAHLLYPSRRPKNRDVFWRDYKSRGLKYVLNKYGKGSYFNRFKQFVMMLTRKLGIYNFIASYYLKLMKKQG